MADDFVTNPGAGGATFAADDIGGVLFPRVKLVLGTDGVNGGDVSATTPLPVSGTFWQTTQPVSASALPLPTGAATETTLAAMNTKTPALGQAAMAASQPVVIASNQTAIPVISSEDAPITGTITAVNQTVTYTNAFNKDALLISVDGTYAATMIIEAQYRVGAPFVSVAVNPQDVLTTTIGTLGAYTNQTRAWLTNLVGVVAVQIRCTAFTSGTVNVRMVPSSRPVMNTAGVVAAQIGTWTVALSANTPTLAAGTNLAGDVGLQLRANATGAASVAALMSPVTPAALSVKATAGRVAGWHLQNSSTGLRSVKFFNVAAPTLGTTAAIYEVDIPAGGVSTVTLSAGIGHSTAIVVSVTSAKGLSDNTATGLAVNDVSGVIMFA